MAHSHFETFHRQCQCRSSAINWPDNQVSSGTRNWMLLVAVAVDEPIDLLGLFDDSINICFWIVELLVSSR